MDDRWDGVCSCRDVKKDVDPFGKKVSEVACITGAEQISDGGGCSHRRDDGTLPMTAACSKRNAAPERAAPSRAPRRAMRYENK